MVYLSTCGTFFDQAHIGFAVTVSRKDLISPKDTHIIDSALKFADGPFANYLLALEGGRG